MADVPPLPSLGFVALFVGFVTWGDVVGFPREHVSYWVVIVITGLLALLVSVYISRDALGPPG